MVKLLTAFVVILIITSCHSVKRENKKVGTETLQNVQFDTSIIAIIPFDTSYYWIFKNCKTVSLTTNDIKKIEQLLPKGIKTEQEKRFQMFRNKFPDDEISKKDFVIKLRKYQRQYVAVINDKGEKEVWINCFCETLGDDWRKIIISVDDGGKCFFNIKMNLTKGIFYEFYVNGSA